jgi:hypothetical protein
MMKITKSAQALAVSFAFKHYDFCADHIETGGDCSVEGGEHDSNFRAVC